MSDHRRRARVQGSWATHRPAAPAMHRPAAHSYAGTPGPVQSERRPPSWARGAGGGGTGHLQRSNWEEQDFEFQQPTQLLRQAPAQRVIDSSGEFEISAGPSGVSRLRLFHNFLSTDEADWMFSRLLNELPWSQKTNYSRGHAYQEPRLTCWFGDLPYTYSHSSMNANTQWPNDLLALRTRLFTNLGLTMNSVLCNFYRDGHDSIAWHSDDETSLGPQPTIASVSLGDTRVFSLRKKPDLGTDFTFSQQIKIPLSHGTLLVMEGATQDDWQHQVAKEYHDRGPRINLTFRTIHPEPRGQTPGARGWNRTYNRH